MGFALFALSSLYQPLRRVAQRMRPRPTLHAMPGRSCNEPPRNGGAKAADPDTAAAHRLPEMANAAKSTGDTGDTGAQCRASASPRPLRVILNRHDGQACRLVISGRMADVCAELERLALH
mgnify:CR=1 FL=1